MAKHRNPLPTAEEKAQRKLAMRLDKTKKTALALLAVAVVVAAFLTYSHFFGNPFSKMTAEGDIKEYISATYPSLDLELSGVKYDREQQSFYAFATSKTSEDIHFAVYCKAGNCTDYYSDAVEHLYNTIERFEKAFSDTAKGILVQKNIAVQNDEVSIFTANFIDARDSGEFQLDMPVTTDLETDFAIHVTLEGESTVKNLAETVTALHNALDGADLPDIVFYNLVLTDGEKTAKAYNITVESITSGNLEAILQNAYEDPFGMFSDENPNPLTVSVK